MYCLLDECCPKSLVTVAAACGHTAQRTIAVPGLGRRASDAAIFAFAREAGAVIVTVNQGDFLALAARDPDHAGLILLPSVSPAAMATLFRSGLRSAEALQATYRAFIVTIDARGRIHPVAET